MYASDLNCFIDVDLRIVTSGRDFLTNLQTLLGNGYKMFINLCDFMCVDHPLGNVGSVIDICTNLDTHFL